MPIPERPETIGLYELISGTASRDGNAVALLSPDSDSLNYSQLLNQVDHVGHVLSDVGIERSDRVAVVLPNGPEMAAAFLGVASYATCAPLNPAYRHDDFEFYLSDLQARALILPVNANHPARDVAKQMGIPLIELQSVDEGAAGQFELLATPANSESRPAYTANEDVALVLHTSGTTSRPKQVPLSHSNLLASARNISGVLNLNMKDRCLNVMPLFHIHGLVGVLLSSMYAGGSVVCSQGFESDSFPGLLAKFQPSWYSAVPTMHQAILLLAKNDPSIAEDVSLRLIRSSSSALPPSVMQDLEDIFGVPMIESYGMTEAAHQMASNPLPPGIRKPGSVGLPAGPEMAIMDDNGHLPPHGEIGEIVIRGANVTKGYVNNPDANEAAFVNGWFRTGDRGRTDSDGYFYITGRTKEMINRGGENISPREIDEALLEHPAVEQAVAFAVPHASLGEDVAAAVVLSSNTQLSETELRDFAFGKLADFKVPSQIVFVEVIPKGPTGKLQRIGLHEQLSDALQQNSLPPQSELEHALLDLWQQVLPDGDIGITHNFFASGGDSLSAGRLMARINSQFDLNLEVTSVFRAPTIATQAIQVEAALLDQIESDPTL